MKKSRLLNIFLTLVMCIVMAGCGNRDVPAEEPQQQMTEETTEEETAVVVEETESPKKEEAKEVAEETEEETVEEETEEQNDSDAVAGPVSNNGGHFVGYNEWVYYVEPSDKSMQEPKLFGEFLDSFCGENVLQAYNVKAGNLNPLYTDNIYGRLWISGNILFTSVYYPDTEDPEKIIMYNLDTNDKQYAEGKILLKGDDSARYVITRDYSEGNEKLYVYDNGKLINTIEATDFVELVGVGEGYAVVAYSSDDYTNLKSIELATGEEVILGTVPSREDSGFGNYPEFEHWAIKDGKVYVSIGFYEGTGHFLAEQEWITADLRQADSIEKADVKIHKEDEFNTSPFVIIDGKMEGADGEPMRGFIDNSTGEYGYVDEYGKAVVSGKGFEFSVNDVGLTFECETMEYVNGRVFAYNHNMVREPDEDIGWREAYIRAYTSIFLEEVGKSNGFNIISYINPDFIDGD